MAASKQRIKSEWRRGIYREVLRRGDHIVKRYVIPASARRVDRSWLKEKHAWERLGVSVWFSSRRSAEREVVVLVRPLVEGTEAEVLEPEALSACLAALHEKGIVGLDPHPGNFLLGEAGTLHMIDLGRAKCLPPRSLRSLMTIGHELYRVERDALQASDFAGYRAAYRQRQPKGWRLVLAAFWLHRSGRRFAALFGQ